MKQYKDYEVTAINTGGLWYGYASKDGKSVFSSVKGYAKREDAIAEAEVAVNILSA